MLSLFCPWQCLVIDLPVFISAQELSHSCLSRFLPGPTGGGEWASRCGSFADGLGPTHHRNPFLMAVTVTQGSLTPLSWRWVLVARIWPSSEVSEGFQRNNAYLVSGTMKIKCLIWIGLNCDFSYLDVDQNDLFSVEFRAPGSSVGPSLCTVFVDISHNFLYWLTVGMWRNITGAFLDSCDFPPTKVPSRAFQGILQGQDCDCVCTYNILHLRTDSSVSVRY